MKHRHARITPDGQRAPAQFVDVAEGEVGSDHIDRAEDGCYFDAGDGRADGGGLAGLEEARQELRAVIERHVDPGDLLEDEKDADHDQCPPDPSGPLRFLLPLPRPPGELVRGRLDLGLRHVHPQ